MVIKDCAIKTYLGVEVQLHLFLTSALDGWVESVVGVDAVANIYILGSAGKRTPDAQPEA